MGIHVIHSQAEDPCYETLVALILSARTKDAVTFATIQGLRKHGLTAENILETPVPMLMSLIAKVNHHKKKTLYLKEMTSMLLEKFDGRVPDTEAELKQLKGVGEKSALLYLQTVGGKAEGARQERSPSPMSVGSSVIEEPKASNTKRRARISMHMKLARLACSVGDPKCIITLSCFETAKHCASTLQASGQMVKRSKKKAVHCALAFNLLGVRRRVAKVHVVEAQVANVANSPPPAPAPIKPPTPLKTPAKHPATKLAAKTPPPKARMIEPEMKIWIGNLPEDCTWKDLQTLGNTVAATRWAEVFRGKGKGTGMIAYKTAEDVTEAMKSLPGKEINGQTIQVDAWQKAPPAEAEGQSSCCAHAAQGEEASAHHKFPCACKGDTTSCTSSKNCCEVCTSTTAGSGAHTVDISGSGTPKMKRKDPPGSLWQAFGGKHSRFRPGFVPRKMCSYMQSTGFPIFETSATALVDASDGLWEYKDSGEWQQEAPVSTGHSRFRPGFVPRKMCSYVQSTGFCEKGDACTFAHSEDELQNGHAAATSHSV
eukprot:s3785_g1.t2